MTIPRPDRKLDPEDFAAMIPFARTVGISLLSATPHEVVGEMPWSAERTTSAEVTHGGALMSLADTIGAVCAFLNLAEGATTATTSSHTLFLRAARTKVTATARPINIGRTSIAVLTELRDSDGKLVSQTTQTQAVLAARG